MLVLSLTFHTYCMIVILVRTCRTPSVHLVRIWVVVVARYGNGSSSSSSSSFRQLLEERTRKIANLLCSSPVQESSYHSA